MIYNTISTLGLSQRMSKSLTGLQLQLLENNDEMASGVHYDMAESLGARTAQDITLRSLLDQTEQYLTTNTLYQGRLGNMNSALTSILSAGTEALSSASTALGTSSTASSLQVAARGALEQIIGLFNSASGSGFLFSGVDVDTTALRQVDGDTSGLPSPLQIVKDTITAATGGNSQPADAAETTAVVAALDELFAVRNPTAPLPSPLTYAYEGGFYTGTTALKADGTDNPRASAQIDGSASIEYGVQANDEGPRTLLEGLYMLAAIDASSLSEDAYPGYIEAAVERISKGVSQVREATAMLGIQRAQVDDAVERLNVQKKLLNADLAELEGIDLALASSRLSQIEAQIEAASSATARLQNMSLVKYL